MSAAIVCKLEDVAVPSRRDSALTVIEGVNWEVRAGEFWIVGGVQGSRKSDFVFMLAGLTKPLRGCYELFEQDMGEHFGDEFLPNRLRTGMVFDDARLINGLTVAENVALPIRYHQNLTVEESASWVSALMKETDIVEFAQDMPSAVPRYWRVRTSLARALALRPEVLFLENPVRGMDARHTSWWAQFVTKLWRGHSLMAGKPMTIVASTDEFRPWRRSGAQFAELHGKQFFTRGTVAPEDEEIFAMNAEEQV
ncbi:MAG TPA: ATP-binding cassette domain-containing protein [Candidatus Acidoferrum sp.]|nr:ATP-binding cassette domain-containing protein [Candidatus Acidoferrum sp.]